MQDEAVAALAVEEKIDQIAGEPFDVSSIVANNFVLTAGSSLCSWRVACGFHSF